MCFTIFWKGTRICTGGGTAHEGGLGAPFEYTAATVDGEGRQETLYLENADDGCLDLRADAPQGASRKDISWHGPLQHRFCLSMEKDTSLFSPVYSL